MREGILILGVAAGLLLLLPACAIGPESALRVENASLKQVVDHADSAVRNSEERNRVLEVQLQAEIAMRKVAEEKVALLKDALQRMRGSLDAGRIEAHQAIQEGFEVNPLSGGIILEDSVYFASGKHKLRAAGMDNLKVLAGRLLNPEYAGFNIRVDGHTDNQPIKKSPYRDNWQLGLERAKAVQDFFILQGVGPGRIFVATFADSQPIADNFSAAGRKRNRRVEIQIIDGYPEEE